MDDTQAVVFGINPVLEKLRASAGEVAEIFVAQGAKNPAIRSIVAEASRHGLRVTYARADVLNRLAGGERHQGVLAQVQPFAYLTLADLIERLSGSDSGPVLLLDGLTDPRNFGALLRSAEAAGVRHVVIPKDRSVGVTPTVAKASAGAVHHLHIYQVTNLRSALAALKERGFWTVGLDSRADRGMHDVVYPEKLGIVVGGEGKGIRPLILRECDYVVSIPMLGKVASLNVSVAGAVFFYELLRQKQQRKR